MYKTKIKQKTKRKSDKDCFVLFWFFSISFCWHFVWHWKWRNSVQLKATFLFSLCKFLIWSQWKRCRGFWTWIKQSTRKKVVSLAMPHWTCAIFAYSLNGAALRRLSTHAHKINVLKVAALRFIFSMCVCVCVCAITNQNTKSNRIGCMQRKESKRTNFGFLCPCHITIQTSSYFFGILLCLLLIWPC